MENNNSDSPIVRRRSRIRSHDQGADENDEDENDINGSETQEDIESQSQLGITRQQQSNRPARKRRREEIKTRDNINSFFTVIIFIGLSLLFVKYVDDKLPTALTIAEDCTNDTCTFTEERARNDLHKLVSAGVRVAGSQATDELTVRNFLNILKDIEKTISETQSLDISVQQPSGEFYLSEKSDHISTYSNISNVVVKLGPSGQFNENQTSILVNCHFDTKAGSPGATDNMISCATMLEILRVLSRRAIPLRNSVIFLFNGAEEYGLQGAHGFVAGRSQVDNETVEYGHPFSKNVRTFINLEGAGAGGREILFQTGPGNGWNLKSYASSVPRPYGLVIAEEAFQLGLIPSDTDFRIFRDFLGIPGADMAFIKNGWVYHTKWDKLTEIPAGSIQHMGDNAFAFVEHLGNLEFSLVEESDGKMIFFDVFGWFMIYYTEIVGIIVNCLVALFAIGLICLEVFVLDSSLLVLTTPKIKLLPKDKPIVQKLLSLIWLPVSTLLAWGVGILVAYVVALLFNWAGYNKPFYSYPTMAFVLFGVPAILGQAILYAFAHRGSESRTWLAGKTMIAIVTLILTFITRIAYVFMITLLFGFIGRYAARFAAKFSPFPNKEIQRLLVYLILGELIPFTLICYLTASFADIFVPIMGRSGTETNPNVFFGLIIAGIVSVLAFNGLVSIFATYNKPILIASLCVNVLIVNPMLVFGFVGKVPFQEKTPLRLQLVDVDRTWYDQDMNITKNDTGYWFWQVDPNTMDIIPIIGETVPEVNSAIELDANIEDCEDIFCAQPFLWPTLAEIKKTPWIQKIEDKSIRYLTGMTITENIIIPNYGRRVTFAFTGPSQLTVVLSPGHNYQLGNWSFAGVPAPLQHGGGLPWKGRETYFIFHSKKYAQHTPFIVTCYFLGPNTPDKNLTLVDVLFTGSLFPNLQSQPLRPNFADLTGRFPSWTNVMSWTAVMKIYSIY